MAGLCESGNEPPGSLKAISQPIHKVSRNYVLLGIQFEVCHGSLYAVMWLADEPREFNLPTLLQRCIIYEAEKLPSKYSVHSEEFQCHIGATTILEKTSGYWDFVIKEAIEIQLVGNNFNRDGGL
ncbi:hypothetical protein ANN_14019 [Periplaneta americana]|uniref:Uncharacterized protein n=1 Tax=Periplaneta americana TaxID=6978 RepID=A0ABQ8SWG9_PERAM|nr:hypothetical protein ANN_14019 [Periplaneta americana]